jgi:hypothetical protein
MPSVLGLTVLVLVATVGLTQLAVRGQRVEYRMGVTVVVGLAFPLLFVAPAAALLLLAACAGTGRLARAAAERVPDRLPRHWAA